MMTTGIFNFFRKNFNTRTSVGSLSDFINFFGANYTDYSIDETRFLQELHRNPFTSAAINRISDGLNNLVWSTYKKGRGDNINDVKFSYVKNTIDEPSKLTNTDQFIDYFALYYVLFGELLVQKVDLGSKADLILYRKGTYTLEFNTNILQGLKTIRIGASTFSGDDLKNFHYVRNTNINNKVAGLGTGISNTVSLALFHDYYCLIMKWNNSILKRGGKRDFALIFKKFMNDKKKEEAATNILNASGASNIYKPLVLDGSEVDLVNLDFSPKDFDFLQAIDEIRNMTSNVLNVPSILIGDRTNQKFSNYKEAKKDLYTETIIPLAETIKEYLNKILKDKLQPNEFIDYDTSKIEVLKDDRATLINMLTNASFLTINEKRAILEYDAVEGGDEILLSGIYTPLSEVGMEVEPFDEGGTEDVNGKEEEEKDQTADNKEPDTS